MALNSLYPDGWFALGAAALKVIYFWALPITTFFLRFLYCIEDCNDCSIFGFMFT